MKKSQPPKPPKNSASNFSKPLTPSTSAIAPAKNYSNTPVQSFNEDEQRKLTAYRKFVTEKIYQIQEELIKVRNKYPDKSAELSGLFKYTSKIMEIANEDPFKAAN